MKLRLGNGLLPLNILVIALIAVVTFFPASIVRAILGLPMILFCPGYTLVAALYPRKNDLDGIERVALSFVMSLAVVPLIALLLNYTPWGIRLYPILISESIFIFAASIAGGYRQWRLPRIDRLSFSLDWHFHFGGGRLDKTLSLILAVAVLGVIGTLVFVALVPRTGEKFTEFYLLGPQGQATGYRTNLPLGETGRVTVVIVNQEHKTVDYNMEVTINGTADKWLGPVTLPHGEKWQNEVTFTPSSRGDNQKVEFLLYQNGSSTPTSHLYLWISVR